MPGYRPSVARSQPASNFKERSMLHFNKRRATDRRLSARIRPNLEALEERVVLSTFNVNTTLDTVAVNFMTGQDVSGHISLRSAVMAADASSGSNTIVLPAGTFKLTIPPAGSDGSANGDLEIASNVSIEGSTTGRTIINGNKLDRVIHIESGTVAISNAVIENGRAGTGGGILNSGGTVTLTSVQLVDNVAIGAVGAAGAPGADRFPVGTNGGTGGAGGSGAGGAILNQAGSLTLNDCEISANEAIGGAGGNGGDGGFGGPLEGIVRADVSSDDGVGGAGGLGGHGGTGDGGGVFNAAGARLILSGDTFSNNHATGGAGGVGGEGGVGEAIPSDVMGNSGTGGAGGAGGTGGLGAGAGLFNLGAVTFSGASTRFNGNQAKGGIGGNGGVGGAGSGGLGGEGVVTGQGEPGGPAFGGTGGAGGQGGAAEGGAVFNGTGASIASTTAVLAESNSAVANLGGAGGAGGQATGGQGGDGTSVDSGGIFTGPGGAGGQASAGSGGGGGAGGLGEGGGLFNARGGAIIFKTAANASSSPASTFAKNQATGGGGGTGGQAGNALGGTGGNGGIIPAEGGPGGFAEGGTGGNGGAGGEATGGGFYDDGTASFTGVTMNFQSNKATGGTGGVAGSGGTVQGGTGGTGTGAAGGQGGAPTGGNGGSGGASGIAKGGGITVDVSGSLVLNPRLGVKPLSKKASVSAAGATDVITLNSAVAGGIGGGGAAGSATPGPGGPGDPVGNNGTVTAGHAGVAGALKQSEGGGIAIFGTATGDNTTVTGNHASKFPNIEGKLST
jgi:hypothetical protein